MAELSQEQPSTSAAPMVGPGAQLKAGREAQQQSLEQAARHLRLDEPTLAAIEADQYPAHVPATFLRGYLRAYAKWLELPADAIVAAYNAKHPDEAQLAGLKNLLALPESSQGPSRKWLGGVVLVLALVAVVVAGVIWVPGDWLQRLKTSDAIATTDVAIDDLQPTEASSGELSLQLPPEQPLSEPSVTGEIALETAPVSAEPSADGAKPAASAPAGGVVAPISTPSSPSSATTGSTTALPSTTNAAISTAAPIPGVGETLELVFVEDCWIRVTDASGNVLSVGIKQNGQRIRLSGPAPLTVVLGNPPGVQLRHNGRPVDLSPYPASRPATLTLQQQAND